MIVHSARFYCKSKMESSDPTALLKIDFENAFNSIRQDAFIDSVRKELPCLYPFLYQCYSDFSFLIFNYVTLLLAAGIQQGDPLFLFKYSKPYLSAVLRV